MSLKIVLLQLTQSHATTQHMEYEGDSKHSHLHCGVSVHIIMWLNSGGGRFRKVVWQA